MFKWYAIKREEFAMLVGIGNGLGLQNFMDIKRDILLTDMILRGTTV